MTAPPFVWNVRSRNEIVRVGAANGAAMNVRVEVPEVWDVVRVAAEPSASVLEVKRAALDVLVPGADVSRYVIKLRGYEVLDEAKSLSDAGALDGSIFLLTHRRRRPVR
ncbi:MAG: hypothetical protein WKG32_04560 [Gemmatimonadaceae bacterium]